MGKAFLIGVNFDTEEIQHQMVEGDNAIQLARRLRNGVQDDWPGYEWYTLGDKDAKKVWGDYSVKHLMERGVVVDD